MFAGGAHHLLFTQKPKLADNNEYSSKYFYCLLCSGTFSRHFVELSFVDHLTRHNTLLLISINDLHSAQCKTNKFTLCNLSPHHDQICWVFCAAIIIQLKIEINSLEIFNLAKTNCIWWEVMFDRRPHKMPCKPGRYCIQNTTQHTYMFALIFFRVTH